MKPHGAHKRSLSGTIIAKLNFLHRANEDGRPPSADKEALYEEAVDEDSEETSPTSPKASGAMAAVIKQSKTRKRKGSLRKTALLGGRRFTVESRERKGSLLPRSPSSKQPPVIPASAFGGDFNVPTIPDAPPTLERKYSYELPIAASSSDSGWSETAGQTKLSLNTFKADPAPQPTEPQAQPTLASPIDVKSPTSVQSYTSTTSEDEGLTFDLHSQTSLKKPPSSTSSYFPAHTTVLRRRSSAKNNNPRSPLSYHAPTFPPPATDADEHDYTETAYWGYVILVATWLVFTVGMGSCLEIWSWAWDVGETPYAPPELEDDPTLPIVGYYPCLLVLTGVVCWVWVSVAWVGMKYFRHAKIEV